MELVARAIGIGQLVLRGGHDLTALAGRMHAVIARAPHPFDRSIEPDAGDAPFVYRIVSGSFASLAALAARIPVTLPSEPAPAGWRRFQSVLNGLLGDKLVAWGNPLATPMALCDLSGAAVPLPARGRLLVLVHGLCATELNFATPALQALVVERRALGDTVACLRYNTGRAVHENGRELAALLDGTSPDLELMLVGHSMGGLVVRSACAHAAAHAQSWLPRLTHAAYLATPHLGAPLERAGHLATAALGLSPYAAALHHIAHTRSQGIKDLRLGCVTPDEAAGAHRFFFSRRTRLAPLPPHVSHLFVAATLTGAAWMGDGLVPKTSALAETHDTRRGLSAPKLRRVHLGGAEHTGMLADPRTAAALRTWLAERD